MNDPIIQRSVGLKQSRWLWLDALARASGGSTSQLLRDVVESFVLNSVAPAGAVSCPEHSTECPAGPDAVGESSPSETT